MIPVLSKYPLASVVMRWWCCGLKYNFDQNALSFLLLQYASVCTVYGYDTPKGEKKKIQHAQSADIYYYKHLVADVRCISVVFNVNFQIGSG